MTQQKRERIHNPQVVTGTLAWPTIKHTRLTLFDLMDHLKQGLPPHFVASWYGLTGEDMDEVMRFLTEHETANELPRSKLRGIKPPNPETVVVRTVLARQFGGVDHGVSCDGTMCRP